jgi:hypothetical protein
MLVPVERLDEWHAQAIMTAGLTELDRKVLDTIGEWYRRLYAGEFEGALSFGRMAGRLDVDPVHVRWAVARLIELGLIAVKTGAGWRNDRDGEQNETAVGDAWPNVSARTPASLSFVTGHISRVSPDQRLSSV